MTPNAAVNSEFPIIPDNAFRSLRQLLRPGPQLSLHGEYSLDRNTVENYVAKQFEAAYGAKVSMFMPLFLSLSCHTQLSAVTGINPADRGPLFLEQYLDKAIEDAIGTAFNTTADRHGIAEIGNLAATQRGSSQLLFVLLAATLHRSGFHWLSFTATPQVRKTICRLGFELRVVGEASLERLSNGAADAWGSYYQSRPMVVVGDLEHAMDVIASKRILSGILALYCNRIDTLATQIQYGVHHAEHYFAA
ncbi:thermostable hemolysin [Porticoccus sp.]